jgi:SSS family solute:Na+ symporter
MIIYVVFGGTRGAGLVGMVKLALVYCSMILCGVLVLKMTGGFDGFVAMVNALDTPNGEDYLNVFGRGVSREVGSCMAMIIGITTTQIYAQVICAAKSDGVARWGTIASALLIPIIGALGILVGLYMRAHYPDIVPKTALTQFVLLQMPELLSGVILGTLFVTVVGSGAGLALGISTIINNDIIQVLGRKWVHAETRSRRIRILIVAVLLTAALTCMMLETDVILNFAFLSMGLRGTVVFAPLCCALWLKNRIDPRWAILAIVLGPFTEFILPLFVEMPFNPLFAGVGMTFLIMGAGLVRGRHCPLSRTI